MPIHTALVSWQALQPEVMPAWICTPVGAGFWNSVPGAVLVADATIAVEAADLPASTDANQIAFGLEALAARVSPARRLYGDERAAEHAKESMLRLLGQRTKLK